MQIGCKKRQPASVNEIRNYVASVANYFQARLVDSLVEVYELGSLAHGGFSQIYSDIDVGLILNCSDPPDEMDRLISTAKGLDGAYGNRLSIFWGNPERDWGRLPVLDRLDLLDHGVPLLHDRKALFRRPAKETIHRVLLDSVEKSWRSKTAELCQLSDLQPTDRKPYVRCLLYAARLIYTWDRLEINSNDRAVEYLRRVKPRGLNLHPIERALECRHNNCRPEEIFAENIDLNDQLEKTIRYISNYSRPTEVDS